MRRQRAFAKQTNNNKKMTNKLSAAEFLLHASLLVLLPGTEMKTQ